MTITSNTSPKNHAAHYLLALYDFGASSTNLKDTYEREKYYQRPPPVVHDKVLQDLNDESKWDNFFEKGDCYSDFLAFFTKEIKTLGWQETVKKWLFRQGPLTERLSANLNAGQ